MSRINTNISSMNAISNLVGNNADLTTRLERLSTGLRINAGKDDPAGLIASESLRSEMVGLKSGISNSIRANSVLATAEGALNEISALLIDIRGLLVETANTGALSTEEIDANQLQVDSAINTIQRISNATEFQGIKLLNGNRDYVVSGVSSAAIGDYTINAAKLIDGAAMTVELQTVSAADTGYTLFSGAGISGGGAMTIQVGSNRGNTELTFAASTAVSAVQYSIQQVREITGVSAALSTNGFNIVMRSVDFGTDSYVSVEHLGSTQQTAALALQTSAGGAAIATSAKDYGLDAVATVNGTSATAKGKIITVRTTMLDAELDMAAAFSLSTTDQTTSFVITGGGANFAIGSKVDAINTEAMGIMSVAPNELGNSTDGYLNTLKSGATNSLDGTNVYTAQRIIDDAIKDISTLRGRLGAFQKNVLETNINSLTVTLENVTASESAIRDADFAEETAALTRSQILVQANTSTLAMANSNPQSVLALLG